MHADLRLKARGRAVLSGRSYPRRSGPTKCVDRLLDRSPSNRQSCRSDFYLAKSSVSLCIGERVAEQVTDHDCGAAEELQGLNLDELAMSTPHRAFVGVMRGIPSALHVGQSSLEVLFDRPDPRDSDELPQDFQDAVEGI